ncbi:hypothetical protein ACJ41O_002032 [Fusarium nematophilum]
MVYRWAPHKEICYQLYITEGRSLEEVMEHMKDVYQFTPSKRAFQVQFSRWDFPSKQKPAHKDERLVRRVHELWQQNLPQREILRVLTDEDGFDINSRELMRVRARNRWLLRARDGDRARPGDAERTPESPGDSSTDQEGDSETPPPQREESLPGGQKHTSSLVVNSGQSSQNHVVSPGPRSRKLSKRQSRRNRQNAADAGSLVRFPSEMTLNDSKNSLGLDTKAYQETRECFRRICIRESIVKKTVAGPDRWELVKNLLIHERAHLQQTLWVSRENIETKKLALDIICTDVTKRIRNLDTRMTLLDAKNVLGLNPVESREVRTALHEVLSDANFTCKSDGTPEQWEELKKRWRAKSAHVKNLDTAGEDAESRKRARAIEIVARDVIKRLRDEKRGQHSKGQGTTSQKQSRQGESQPATQTGNIEQQHQQPQSQRSREGSFAMPDEGPSRSSSPASPPQMDESDLGDSLADSRFEPVPEVPQNTRMEFSTSGRTIPPQLPMQAQSQASGLSSSGDGLPQPHRMLGSASASGIPLASQYGSSLYLGTNNQTSFMGQPYVSHQFATAQANPVFHDVQPMSTTFAVFLRLHPSSTYVTNTNLWIGTMASQSVQELRQTAVAKFPGALCVRIEGILKDGKGSELPLQIQDDDELGAYFAHMQGGSPTFAVELV